MPLVHYALSTYLERRCSGIDEHSDGNVPELRRAGTTLDGEYLEAHPQALQNVSYISLLRGESIRYSPIR